MGRERGLTPRGDDLILLAAGVDAIVAGDIPAEDCVSSLRGWGGSSGGDALVGMAVRLMN
jgi:hypothetical protein